MLGISLGLWIIIGLLIIIAILLLFILVSISDGLTNINDSISYAHRRLMGEIRENLDRKSIWSLVNRIHEKIRYNR